MIIMQVNFYLKLEHKQLESWVSIFLLLCFPFSAKCTSKINVTNTHFPQSTFLNSLNGS